MLLVQILAHSVSVFIRGKSLCCRFFFFSQHPIYLTEDVFNLRSSDIISYEAETGIGQNPIFVFKRCTTRECNFKISSYVRRLT